ncbi:S41 family peptidase [Paraflavitalea sp. CAU 1676]|uniref:S41 family peptidase n=1 Tax=Paraflavitalea sp. CAU 1676 TaxID=3032598 RepID=UPI0023DB6E4B|nr:S41 family peptidase [Paraflavitalea sp. CAU 1676]MDF2192353.1 S41 family peptidase [Paraflavitalea sp. CAU 1676]
MKWLTTLLLLVSMTAIQAQPKILYYKQSSSAFAQKKIRKADLAQDIKYWMQVMEESHVNLYHATTKKALQSLATRLLAQLPDSFEHRKATLLISTLAASLNEGHLGLAADPVTDSLYVWQSKRFPYFMRGINSEGFVVEVDLSKRTPKLEPGSTILSINGHKSIDLIKKYSRYYGGLEAWKKVSVKDAIRKLLFMDDIKSPFEIVALQGSDTLRYSVDGFSRSEADSITKVLSRSILRPEPFLLKFEPGNIAVIEFNDMDRSHKEKFAAFLDSSFKIIQERKAAGLVVDIRKNGGGDFALGELLISYFTGKPYRNVSAVKYKISSHARAMATLRNENFPFQNEKNGSVYSFKVDALTTPDSQQYRFTGKTALLIGPSTFSSANMLANTIKDYQLATVFGQPTAEPGNDFGEIFPFMLPRTHVIATAPVKMFVRANGNEKDFTGIQPDVFVNEKPGGEDETLQAAVNWLHS